MERFISILSTGRRLPAMYIAQALIKDGAIKLKEEPEDFEEDLVCVVEDEFVCYIQDPIDFQNTIRDPRGKTWLLYEHASSLAK